jgi:murein L,D-transpeptidase YafK
MGNFLICFFALLPLVASAARAELPAWVIEVPDSIDTLLVADTSGATLYEYSFANDGSLGIETFYMSIGQRGAGKTRAGDRKTPLGNYFIVDQLDTSRLDPKYGVTAFPLDYPNAMDRRAGRTGDGIWLHGVLPDGGRRPERDTDGCIALPNEDLAELAVRIELKQTPVIVTREMHYASPDEKAAIGSALRAQLAAWRDAMNTGDVISYLSLYAQEFSYRGLDRDEWAAFRVDQFDAAPETTVDDILILLDPEDPRVAMTRFTARLSGSDSAITLTKRLYWRQVDDDRWLIIAEDNG